MIGNGKFSSQTRLSDTDVDKIKFTIHISQAHKFKVEENNVVEEKLESNELDIAKQDIKEVKLVQYDQLTKQKLTETRDIPLNQSNNPFNALPSNKLSQKTDKNKHYEKQGFFDELGTLSNRETIKQTIKDNEKNSETFNLPQKSNTGYNRNYNNYNNNNYNNNYHRGGYQNRRGGNRGNRRFFNNNNNNYNNNNYNNNNYNNNNYNNYNRGGGQYRQKRGGFQDSNNNMNNDFNDNVDERGTSIYDKQNY